MGQDMTRIPIISSSCILIILLAVDAVLGVELVNPIYLDLKEGLSTPNVVDVAYSPDGTMLASASQHLVVLCLILFLVQLR